MKRGQLVLSVFVIAILLVVPLSSAFNLGDWIKELFNEPKFSPLVDNTYFGNINFTVAPASNKTIGKFYCTDTDNGIFSGNIGTVNATTYSYTKNKTGSFKLTKASSQIRQDTCLKNNKTLSEAYCSYSGRLATKSITCLGGCKNGACVPFVPQPKCVDSDGGKNYVVFGNATSIVNKVSLKDACFNATILNEAECQASGIASYGLGKVCGNGCKEGACIIPFIVNEFSFNSQDYKELFIENDIFNPYIKINHAVNEQIANVTIEITANNTFIDSFEIPCTFYYKYNLTICTKNWFATNILNGTNEYYINATIKSVSGIVFNEMINKTIKFRAWPKPDSGLCVPIIDNHNNLDVNRDNLVFVGRLYDREMIREADIKVNFAAAIKRYCNSQEYTYAQGEYINFTRDFITFNCTRYLNMQPIRTDVFSLSWDEIERYNSIYDNGYYFRYNFSDYFPKIVSNYLGLDNSNFGLFSTKPFRGNLNKFNLWYVNISAGAGNCNLSDMHPGICLQEDDYSTYLFSNCNFSNQYNIQFINGNVGAFGYPIITTSAPFYNYNLSYGSDISKITFLHEWGHLFGRLGEEYITIDSSYPDIINSQSSNCYAGPLHTREECLQNAPWKEMIGTNGVDCFEGCAQFRYGIFRSTQNSIMAEVVSGPSSYGAWNEKIMNNTLNRFTGT